MRNCQYDVCLRSIRILSSPDAGGALNKTLYVGCPDSFFPRVRRETSASYTRKVSTVPGARPGRAAREGGTRSRGESNINEGTKVQNPRRLCHVYTYYTIHVYNGIRGHMRECTGKYTEICGQRQF